MSAEGLRSHYPELRDLSLVDPDIIDNAESLSTIPPDSQDFVVASHFLEHCQDPVATLQTFMRVLQPDGILYLIIPDKRYTFDKDRPSTTREHIVRDFEEGPSWSREKHYREYARLVEHAAPGEAEDHRAQYLMDSDYSVHFHVWTKPEFLELVAFVNGKYKLAYEIRLFLDNGPEGIYVLQKSAEFGRPVKVANCEPENGKRDTLSMRPPKSRPSLWSRIRKNSSPG
jgi:SAM-dependent methyltransferase